MVLLYKSGEFWVWAWVERRIRANFWPPSQVTCLRKKEILGTTRAVMQGARKAEAGLGFLFVLPNLSRQNLQDPNKPVSAREGILTLQVCSVSQIGICGSRGFIWPRDSKSQDRITQLLWKHTSVPTVWTIRWMRKQNPFCISCKSYSPISIFSRKVLGLSRPRVNFSLRSEMYYVSYWIYVPERLTWFGYTYRAIQWKFMGFYR